MKNSVFATILLLFSCLSGAIGQNVAFLKAKAPFPYADGVAMDLTSYQAVKAKLGAAEALKVAADSAILSLMAQVQAQRTALADKKAVIDHDSQEYGRLFAEYTLTAEKLQNAVSQKQQAEKLLESVRALLPKRYRKKADTPEKIAFALEEYFTKLQKRPFRWGLIGLGAGLVGGICLIL